MNSSGKVKPANDSTARLISYNVHQLKNDKQNSCLTWMLREHWLGIAYKVIG